MALDEWLMTHSRAPSRKPVYLGRA
jgi:hypothetical protein